MTDLSTIPQQLRDAGFTSGQIMAPGEGAPLESWIEQEQAAGAAQGINPWNGFSIPKGDTSAFLSMIGYAETWMSNVGYDPKLMPTPHQLLSAVEAGLAHNPSNLWAYFNNVTGAASKGAPGAVYGMSGDQYEKSQESLQNALYDLTGKSDFKSAGLDQGTIDRAYRNGWGAQQLSEHLQKNNPEYSYLKFGYNYSSYQNWKSQNKIQVHNIFGQAATDAQFQQSLANPKEQFHAAGATTTENPQQMTQTGKAPIIR